MGSMTEPQRRQDKLQKRVRQLLMAICIIVIIGCVAVAACEIYVRSETELLDEDVCDLYKHHAATDGYFEITLSATPCAEEKTTGQMTGEDFVFIGLLPEEKIPEVQEGFRALYDENPDVIGWLTLGETIDYPVLQRDNAYYLTHNFYRRRDSNGALFLNESNSLQPRDDVLLIHGHNMKSGAMFGRLMRFSAYEYLCEHPIVTFRTIYDEQDVFYVPIAAFNASMIKTNKEYFDIMQIAFENDKETESAQTRRSAAYRAYLEAVRNRSLWPSPVEADETDELLMLITCSYKCEDGRFLLVCRKLREGETTETVSALFQEVNREE